MFRSLYFIIRNSFLEIEKENNSTKCLLTTAFKYCNIYTVVFRHIHICQRKTEFLCVYLCVCVIEKEKNIYLFVRTEMGFYNRRATYLNIFLSLSLCVHCSMKYVFLFFPLNQFHQSTIAIEKLSSHLF